MRDVYMLDWIIGMISFLLFFLYDWNRVFWKKVWMRSFFAVGTALLVIVGIRMIAKALQGMNGATEGFIIQYVNDQPVKTPQDVIDIVKKSKRAVFVQGVTPSGKTGYFGFGV